MPYRTPTFDDFNHARWLRRDFDLPVLFEPLLARMTEQVRIHAGKSNRRDIVSNIKTTLSVFVANLYRSHGIDENRYVKVQSRSDSYPSGPMNPLRLSSSTFKLVIDYMSQEDYNYIDVRGGNFDRGRGIGYTRRFRAGRQLIDEIEGFLIDEVREINHIPITGRTLNDLDLRLQTSLFHLTALSTIRLKGQKAEGGRSAPFIAFTPTDDTRRMERNLAFINSQLNDNWVDLLIPDQEFSRILRERNVPEDENEEWENERHSRGQMDIDFDKSLYRVFNNGTFDQGGRFYGGWWQMVPRDSRKYLTINWYPTAELDYSNMQIAMLYAQEGVPLEGDAYSIEGVGPQHRDLIKQTLLQVINAEGRFEHPRRADLPEGWDFARLLAAIEARHARIARHFRSGIGIQLQRRDADVAERVMLTLMDEGIVALPIHDSFLVPEGRQARLRQVMAEAYREEMGQDVAIQADETLYGDLPRDDDLARELGFANSDAYRLALDSEGIQALGDPILEIENRPTYAQYRARKRAFLQMQGEHWGHTHDFLH